MIETKLEGKTPDIGEENIKKLKAIFPEVFTEGKVDFEKLKQVLGDYVEDSNERYNFTWNGKGRALRLSQTPSLGTLRPCKEESKNWDTTENLYIEGDNLEVLKLLQKSYYGKVKMIYIDPPYNTGKDFVYKDDFHDSLENYKRITGQVDGNGKRLSTNTETSGRYHTDWLNMMYPRLRLARNLLTDDGVIFISIDDNEVDNLKKICNEIFGEDNFVNMVTVKMSESSGNKMAHVEKRLPKLKEYILIYKKGEIKLNPVKVDKPQWDDEYSMYFSNFEKEHKKLFDYISNKEEITDEDIENVDGILSKVEYDTVTRVINGLGLQGDDEILNWKYKNAYRIFRTASSTSVRKLVDKKKKKNKNKYFSVVSSKEKILYIAKTDYDDDSKAPRVQIIFAEDNLKVNIGDIWNDISTTGLEFEGEVDFKNGKKPLKLMDRVLRLCIDKHSWVLDFFSGSATTAHAVMQLNAEDGGNRKFIMVQLPEQTDEKSEAYKAGYMNISEIGKERIRRAGEKIKEENKDKEGIEDLDIGFKVLKLDTSNIRKWQPDYDNLEQSLLDYVDNYVEGRTELDVVYEIMLKYGLDLTYPVDEFTIANKKVYSIGFGMLMICLDNEITTEVAKGIIEKAKELKPEENTRVVFKDNGFKTDSNKTNIKEILKSAGIEEFITL